MINLFHFSDATLEDASGLDGDSSDEEVDDEIDDEDEDISLPKDLKGIDLTSDYSPQRPKLEELVKLAPLFPELNNFHVPEGTKFKDTMSSSRRGRKTNDLTCFEYM